MVNCKRSRVLCKKKKKSITTTKKEKKNVLVPATHNNQYKHFGESISIPSVICNWRI